MVTRLGAVNGTTLGLANGFVADKIILTIVNAEFKCRE